MFIWLTKNWYRFHILPFLAAGLAILTLPSAQAQYVPAVTSSSSSVPYNTAPTNVPSNVGYSGIPGPSGIIGTPNGAFYYIDETATYGGVYQVSTGSVIPQPVLVTIPGSTSGADISYGRNLSSDPQGNLYLAAPFTDGGLIYKIPNENGVLNANDTLDIGSAFDNSPCNNNPLCTAAGVNELVYGNGAITDVHVDPVSNTIYGITNACGTCSGQTVLFTLDQAATSFSTWDNAAGDPSAGINIVPQETTGAQPYFAGVLDSLGNYYYTDTTYLYMGNIHQPGVAPVKIGPGYPLPTGRKPPNRYPSVEGLSVDANNNLWINGTSGCYCALVFPFNPATGTVAPADQYVALTDTYGQFTLGFGPYNYVYDGEGYQPGSIRQNVIGAVEFGTSPLGTGVFGKTAAFTFNAAETVGGIAVNTEGSSATSEFQLDSAPGTCTAQAYAVTKSCTVSADYNPTYPGPRAGAIVLADASNNALGYSYLAGFGSGPLAAISPGVSAQLLASSVTVAGLPLSNPTGIAVDGAGNVYIADTGNARVVKIPVNGTPSVVSPASTLSQPVGLALDGAGNLYIADSQAGTQTIGSGASAVTYHGTVFMLTPQGVFTTLIGPGTVFYQSQATVLDYLGSPTGITFDNRGDLYLINGNGAVLRQNPQQLRTIVLAALTQFAGTALNGALAISTDSAGNFYIADTGNNRIVTFSELTFATAVVNTGTTTFNTPSGIAEDAAQNLYIGDASGITQVTSSGTTSVVDLYGATTAVSGIAMDGAGDIYASQGTQNTIVNVAVSNGTISFPETAVGGTSTLQTITIVNHGNAPLVIGGGTNPTVDTGDVNFAAGSGTCAAGSSIPVDSSCTLAATFTPQSSGTLTGALLLAANTASGFVTINLTGAGGSVGKFAITGLPSQAPAGDPLNFAVTAEDASGNALSGYQGTVTFTSSETTPAATLPANYTFPGGNNGTENFQVTFNQGGEQTLTVTDVNNGATGTSPQVLVSAPAANVAVSGGSNQSTPLGQAFTTNLSAIVTDANSNPVAGAVVIFTAPTTGASGTFAGGTATAQAYSSSSGIATAPVFSANGTLGSYSVVASVTNVTSTASFNLTNSPGLTNTALAVSPASPSTYGAPITMSVTVSIPGGSSGSVAGPTGTVTIDDGSTAIGSGPITPVTPSNGTSTVAIVVPSASATALTGGTHSLSAVYGGDNNYQGSTSTPSVPYSIGLATVSVAGPSAEIIGTQGQIVNVPVTITGQYAGAGITAPSGTLTALYCGANGPQVKPSSSTPCGAAGPAVPFTATANVVNGVGTFSFPASAAAGTYALSITYSGDVNYQPQQAPTQYDFSIPGIAFILGQNTASNGNVGSAITAAPGVTVIVPLTITPTNDYACVPGSTTVPCAGLTQTVTFSCSGLPKDASCAFLPAQLQYNAESASEQVAADIIITSPTYSSLGGRGKLGLLWLPCLLLAGYIGTRRRIFPAWGRGLMLVLMLASGLFGISACGGIHQNTPNGTYAFTINANATTAAGTTVTLSVPMTLTITSSAPSNTPTN